MAKTMEAFQANKQGELSSLAKFVKFISRIHLLSLHINYEIPTASYSLLSCKTIAFAFLNFLPFTLVYVWMYLHMDYYSEVMTAMCNIYSIIDIWALAYVPGLYLTPLSAIWANDLVSRLWAAVPELSMDKSIKFPSKLRFLGYYGALLIIREDILSNKQYKGTRQKKCRKFHTRV